MDVCGHSGRILRLKLQAPKTGEAIETSRTPKDKATRGTGRQEMVAGELERDRVYHGRIFPPPPRRDRVFGVAVRSRMDIALVLAYLTAKLFPNVLRSGDDSDCCLWTIDRTRSHADTDLVVNRRQPSSLCLMCSHFTICGLLVRSYLHVACLMLDAKIMAQPHGRLSFAYSSHTGTPGKYGGRFVGRLAGGCATRTSLHFRGPLLSLTTTYLSLNFSDIIL